MRKGSDLTTIIGIVLGLNVKSLKKLMEFNTFVFSCSVVVGGYGTFETWDLAAESTTSGSLKVIPAFGSGLVL